MDGCGRFNVAHGIEPPPNAPVLRQVPIGRTASFQSRHGTKKKISMTNNMLQFPFTC